MLAALRCHLAVLLACSVGKLCWVSTLGLGEKLKTFVSIITKSGRREGRVDGDPGIRNSTRRPVVWSVCGQLSVTHPPGSVSAPPSRSH